MPREQRVAQIFVELADTLVADFDVVDFLHTLAADSVELLGADAAGLILADQRGGLQVMASSVDQARVLELFELQNEEGPCLDCVRSGVPVVNVDPAEAGLRWPAFTRAASASGYSATHALPLRLRGQLIGALNLFCSAPTPLSDADVALGQALADVATIGLLQQRALHEREMLAEQLQTALNRRILIEQAKGMLAERTGLEVAQAFEMMRSYARARRVALGAVAAGVIDGSLDSANLVA